MEIGNIATTDQLFQSIVGMTNAEAVPISSGLGGGSGASSSPGSAPAPAASSSAPSPAPAAGAASRSSSPNAAPPDSMRNIVGVAPGSASILNGLAPGGSVQTDAFGTGAGGVGTTIKLNADGTYGVNGPNIDLFGVSAANMKILMSGNASLSTLGAIESSHTPLFGQSPSTASNYNTALMNGGLGTQGDLTLNNGTPVTSYTYPEYALEQEIKGMQQNSGGTFGMIAGLVAKAALAAAGSFVGGPLLGAALSAGVTEVQTKNAGAAALSGAESYAGSALWAAL